MSRLFITPAGARPGFGRSSRWTSPWGPGRGPRPRQSLAGPCAGLGVPSSGMGLLQGHPPELEVTAAVGYVQGTAMAMVTGRGPSAPSAVSNRLREPLGAGLGSLRSRNASVALAAPSGRWHQAML